MTRLLEPMVCACPVCGGYFLKSRFASFNDFGSTGWTDGYTTIWASKAVTPLKDCPWCEKAFWVEDAQEIGLLQREPEVISRFSRIYESFKGDKKGLLAEHARWAALPDELKNPPYASPASLQNLKDILRATNELSSARELIVRRKIWWASSDHLRLKEDGSRHRDEPALPEQAAIDNKLALLNLLESICSPVEEAELLRQLGRFEAAVKVLEATPAENKDSLIATKLMEFSRAGNRDVREIWRRW